MANRVSASIKLGGTLPRARLGDLLDAIASERLSTEWDGAPFSKDEIPQDAPIELFAHEVVGGSFDQLEAFCMAHGLAFVRTCEGYPGEWDRERLVFNVSGQPRSYRISEHGQILLSLAEVRRLGSIRAIELDFACAELSPGPLILRSVRSLIADGTDEPTIDMWRAIIAFRARYGRTWKSALALRWINGADDNEPYGAALRILRNQYGPSWLNRLRPRKLDDAERRIAQLDRLPVMCASRNLETGEPIILQRGESGYWPLPGGMTVESFNAASAPTPGQIAAMEIGSAFGWDVPGADPANYDDDGRPLAPGRRREGG